MNKKKAILSAILNTPLKVALASFILSELITQSILLALGRVDVVLVGFIIAGICGFFIAYVTSSVIFGYQRVIEEKNRKLERITQALQEANVLLTARNMELDAFARMVAHDLRTPLNVIYLSSDLPEEEFAAMSREERFSFLQTIAQSAREMNSLIDELLLLSRVQCQEIELQPLDMGAIVSQATHRLCHSIEEYQAEIVLPESWPTMWGYGPWVEEIWVNYLSNAIKYGGRPPRVELGATEQPDGSARCWVKDNGIGLEREEQAHLFIPFTRLHRAEATGHGLGLSIVRRIMDRLGGQVGVESEPGQGSTFAFTLPGVSNVPNDANKITGETRNGTELVTG
jgi:two-component system, sensor histidine kinase and response regulator